MEDEHALLLAPAKNESNEVGDDPYKDPPLLRAASRDLFEFAGDGPPPVDMELVDSPLPLSSSEAASRPKLSSPAASASDS